ncbi:hypothetical protein [uncultured Microbacterium sp.]|uniref:hypothetical protein n=1 Tax=uncultured Microbacterium sp. TaxID=191216 RepID=UPI0028D1FF54|nr:hypothetical protein [uncultured Microbacterium sp.]
MPDEAITFFCVAVGDVEAARHCENKLRDLGARNVDVDPSGSGLVDPLTLSVARRVSISGSMSLAKLDEFLVRWWNEEGQPGLVIDTRSKAVFVAPSIAVNSGDVVVIGAQTRSSKSSGVQPTTFAEWIDVARNQDLPTTSRSGAPSDALSNAKEALDQGDVAFGINSNASLAESIAVRSAWIERLWLGLLAGLGPQDSGTSARVRAARVRYKPLRSLAALSLWAGRYTVRINLGMVEGLVECSRTIVGEAFDPAVRGPIDAGSAIEEAGLRMANVLGWMTSVAGFPVSTPKHDLPPTAEAQARGLATGSMLFILAHELGHVIADDGAASADRADAHRREYRADATAMAILQNLAEGSRATLAATELSGLEMSTEVISASAVMYLYLEGAIQLASAAKRRGSIPDRSELAAVTETTTHPSPFLRAAAVRQLIPDSTEALAAVDGMALCFESLFPVIEANLPERVIALEEAERYCRENSIDLVQASALVGKTVGEISTGGLLEFLRVLSEKESVTNSDLRVLTSMAEHTPRTVIDVLARARTGGMEMSGGMDQRRLQAVVTAIAQRIEPPSLRAAVNAEIGNMQMLANW